MPLRESEKWDGQVTIGRGIVTAQPPMVWRQVEMFHVEARREPPFVHLILSRIDVFSVSGFVLEPVVKPATDDRDTVRQNHHRARAER
jgi:hypothetical protein